jgi:3-methyladenine DNA glycosylase AlkD
VSAVGVGDDRAQFVADLEGPVPEHGPAGARVTGTRRPPTDPGHKQLLGELHALAGHGPLMLERPDPASSHTTSGRPFYRISVPNERRLARQWLSADRGRPPEQLSRTVRSLLAGRSYEEKTLGCMIMKERRDVRAEIAPSEVVAWLDDLRGWAEVDSLCQSVFSAEELLSGWAAWRAAILAMSKSDNANKRRASLVLLTGPVHQSNDDRLLKTALRVLDQVIADRDPLVTKAVSWLLRALSGNHPEAVVAYLARHGADLAPVALRETRTKLKTGTKSGR